MFTCFGVCLFPGLFRAFNSVLEVGSFQKGDGLSSFSQISFSRDPFLLEDFLTSQRTLSEHGVQNEVHGSVVSIMSPLGALSSYGGIHTLSPNPLGTQSKSRDRVCDQETGFWL